MLLTDEDIEGFEKLMKVRIATSLPDMKPTCLVRLADNSWKSGGSIDFSKIYTIARTALDTCFQSSKLCRLPYAKP